MRYLIAPLLALAGLAAVPLSASAGQCHHVSAQFGGVCQVCPVAAPVQAFQSTTYGQAYADPAPQARAQTQVRTETQTFQAPAPPPVTTTKTTYTTTASYQAPFVVAAPPAVVTSYYGSAYNASAAALCPDPAFGAPFAGGYSTGGYVTSRRSYGGGFAAPIYGGAFGVPFVGGGNYGGDFGGGHHGGFSGAVHHGGGFSIGFSRGHH